MHCLQGIPFTNSPLSSTSKQREKASANWCCGSVPIRTESVTAEGEFSRRDADRIFRDRQPGLQTQKSFFISCQATCTECTVT